MRTLFASAAILALTAGSALAADPIGDWLVKDGFANIRIDNCAGKMWGIVAWEKTPGALDAENPDPTKRARPVLGMPILLGMKPTKPNLWEGEIYNSNNGKTYDAKISMVDDNTLKLEGCVGKQFFGDLLCGGENWTRVVNPPPGPPLPPVGPTSQPPSQMKAGPAKGAATKGPQTAQPAQSDVCARVAADNSPPRGNAAAKQIK